jgi:hypothetical protein
MFCGSTVALVQVPSEAVKLLPHNQTAARGACQGGNGGLKGRGGRSWAKKGGGGLKAGLEGREGLAI